MPSIACVKWGRRYSADYVNILAGMCRRNISADTAYRFICFTDDATGIDAGIELRPLPEGVERWWNKLALFAPGAFDDGERVLFFDLDTVITGPIDELLAYDGPFAGLENVYEPEELQSSVMAWRAGDYNEVWTRWNAEGRPRMPDGDQEWIDLVIRDKRWLQGILPGAFMSYKLDAGPRGGPAEETKVVFFHGRPKPHQCDDEWVKRIWRMGGDVRSSVVVACNTSDDALFANVRSSSMRDLSWLTATDEHGGHAVIVGGGPSLAHDIEEIRWRASLGQTIVALNGSANFLASHGIIPDIHIILDARPENSRFVLGKVARRYIIASQCDPSVFDTLDGEDVTLFHPVIEGISEHIPNRGKSYHLIGGGTTVGLTSMAVIYTIGYRFLHLYGYDSSFPWCDKQHAYDQPRNGQEMRTTEVWVAGQSFMTGPAMLAQVERFQPFAQTLADMGCTITVHGEGLLPVVAREMGKPQPTGVDDRARAILSRLPVGRPVIGAEIGVFTAALSWRLLERDDLTLYMVDSWEGHGAGYQSFSGDFHAGLSQEEQDEFVAVARSETEFAGDRARIIRKRSVEAAGDVPDGSLDFVFVDADHSYEGCRDDIAAWLPKLKPDGLLCGHDYGNYAFPDFGVDLAVDEFAANAGLRMELGDNFTWFIRLGEAQAQAA
jgi:hypothetical protein